MKEMTSDTMRDPTRIPLVIQLLSDVWTRYPDLRFLQLMSVIQQRTNEHCGKSRYNDTYYIEDNKLIETLEKLKEES